ncbi:MAG: hypothetical protein GFH27_549301n295 [Chloroflexi bacterium AL-W]|nr:hypothetical protein [Chloroflexi bacterium AL-N1]NOK68489.1 hypothetical protein [Chloroflexi bacterium AL-N10]NOK74135.1 hypothetical protein [Chloroflexi bacterium AL-N5]NOK83102.1 hypothetical protein [Chloroflexi bacterium AL-W]NOK90625.1 hypothetical protein [Chloroflexi bacterium AL-N15]
MCLSLSRRTISIGALVILMVMIVAMVFPMHTQASGYKMSDSQARSLLRANGIPVVSSGNCTDRYNPRCTSLEQINSGTINGIIAFKNGSTCPVTVTGGTETGHSSGTYSHWNGYKIDIALSSCVDRFIPAYFTYIGTRGDGAPMYRNSRGDVYAKESNHWDILYY